MIRPDFSERTYELLDSAREPSTTEQKFFEALGYIFTPVEPLTLFEVMLDDLYSFREGSLESILRDLRRIPADRIITDSFLGYRPPKITVGFNPDQMVIRQPLYIRYLREGIQLVDDYSKTEIESEHFPDARALILPATVISQVDLALQQNRGMRIFDQVFVKCLDHVHDGQVVVGRSNNKRSDDKLIAACFPEDNTSSSLVPGLVFVSQ